MLNAIRLFFLKRREADLVSEAEYAKGMIDDINRRAQNLRAEQEYTIERCERELQATRSAIAMSTPAPTLIALAMRRSRTQC